MMSFFRIINGFDYLKKHSVTTIVGIQGNKKYFAVQCESIE